MGWRHYTQQYIPVRVPGTHTSKRFYKTRGIAVTVLLYYQTPIARYDNNRQQQTVQYIAATAAVWLVIRSPTCTRSCRYRFSARSPPSPPPRTPSRSRPAARRCRPRLHRGAFAPIKKRGKNQQQGSRTTTTRLSKGLFGADTDRKLPGYARRARQCMPT